MPNETSSQQSQTCMLLRHFTQIYYIISTGWSYHWTTQPWKYNQRVSGHGRWDSAAPKWRVLILIKFPCGNVFGIFCAVQNRWPWNYIIRSNIRTPPRNDNFPITSGVNHCTFITRYGCFYNCGRKDVLKYSFFLEFYFDSYQCIPQFDTGYFLCNSMW